MQRIAGGSAASAVRGRGVQSFGRCLAPAPQRRAASRICRYGQEDDVVGAPAPELRAEEPEAQAVASTSQPALKDMPYTVMAGLAGLGVAETAYLTMVKLAGAPLVCPSSGCDSVLTSSYSTLFGLPLSLYGMLAYGAVFALALKGVQQQQQAGSEGAAAAVTTAPATLDTALLGGSILLSSCSAVLLYILSTQFAGEPCAWCYLSSGLSLSLLAAALAGRSSRQLQDAAAPSLGVLAGTILVLSLGFGGLGSSQANEDFQLPFAEPDITTSSPPKAVELAKRLRLAGAKMYGAFWCTHCFDQKQEFGREAMAEFPYVECYPSGWKRGVPLATACDAAGVRAFPTWVINGQLIEGGLSLDQLEEVLAAKQQQAPAVQAQ